MLFSSKTPGGNTRPRRWKESAHFYDAAITVDMILGYPWLRSRQIGVLPHLNALAIFDRDGLNTRILRPPLSFDLPPADLVINLVRGSELPIQSDPVMPDPANLPSEPEGATLRRLKWCLRQISFGKATPEYQRYTQAVPIQARET